MAPGHDHPKKKKPAAPDFLQPSPCAYADDFAVAASSFRLLMTALSPASAVVDRVAGLNHRKCCWVQSGSESCHDLIHWVAINCEDREMNIVKYAKYTGTTIGDSTTGNFILGVRKIKETT